MSNVDQDKKQAIVKVILREIASGKRSVAGIKQAAIDFELTEDEVGAIWEEYRNRKR